MIEINLIAKKKANRLPVVLGIDLNIINLKALLISLVLGYGVKFFIETTWDSEFEQVQASVENVKVETKKYDDKLKESQELKKVLEVYLKQMTKLKEKEKVVSEVLSRRNNPRSLLERLARNTPNDLWFTSLSIDPAQMLEIKGRSLSYKSIGDFSVMAGESRFMSGKKLELKSSETVEEKDGDSSRRVEAFTLVGKIEAF